MHQDVLFSRLDPEFPHAHFSAKNADFSRTGFNDLCLKQRGGNWEYLFE
jgi:hypothetical protein